MSRQSVVSESPSKIWFIQNSIVRSRIVARVAVVSGVIELIKNKSFADGETGWMQNSGGFKWGRSHPSPFSDEGKKFKSCDWY